MGSTIAVEDETIAAEASIIGYGMWFSRGDGGCLREEVL